VVDCPPVGGPLLPLLEVVEIAVILALAACTGWLALRSLPAGLRSRQNHVEEVTAGLSVEVQAIVAERATWRAQGERLAEEVSTYLEQIERKRSSTAAAASRLKKKEENGQATGDPANMSRADQIALARRQLS